MISHIVRVIGPYFEKIFVLLCFFLLYALCVTVWINAKETLQNEHFCFWQIILLVKKEKEKTPFSNCDKLKQHNRSQAGCLQGLFDDNMVALKRLQVLIDGNMVAGRIGCKCENISLDKGLDQRGELADLQDREGQGVLHNRTENNYKLTMFNLSNGKYHGNLMLYQKLQNVFWSTET